MLELTAQAEGVVVSELVKAWGVPGVLLIVAGFVIRSLYKSRDDDRLRFEKAEAAYREAAEKKKDDLHAERLADLRTFANKQNEVTQQAVAALTNSTKAMEAQSQAVNGLQDALGDLAEEFRRKSEGSDGRPERGKR